jgi:murein DD-endopeptidase MepM/ murein hydrolase activator NlpD
VSDRPTSNGRPGRPGLRVATGIIALLAILALTGAMVATGGLAELGGLGGLGGRESPAGPAGGATGPTSAPSPPVGSPDASPSPSAAVPSGPASPSPGSGAAPISAIGFRLRHTVVPMGFPLPAASRYRYGDRWRVPRVGKAYSYEEVRGVAPDGTLLRAHDGVDLVVSTGTPILGVFDGIVIDPTTRWLPWDPSRYGTVVVIQSTESSSPGYMAIAAHLSRRAVHLGDTVRRGQVVGWTGRTGNAAGTIPHLHFELRAPFEIPQAWGGIRRLLDVFDPLPSLLAADLHR